MAWLLQRPLCFLGFGFGTGLAPVAPGTFGTLPALPLAGLLLACGFGSWGITVIAILLFAFGVYVCDYTEQALGIQDYGGIVWDEIVAMLLVLAWTPDGFWWWVLAFVLFRLFDAIKPWPIRWFDQRVHGGFGIMLDDIIAALFVLLVMGVVWMVVA
ncbi:phosphatidylglycerophosphatase A [Vitreoscilla massiliensis]|uniref:Phosphatidylglycerophosphatase A n=1 Tax=Vitreoscilla massiliensis TaxID=1689272 RepID=A0ABY4E758_9NEIS|nr:phosphatidylglycerophosphatase A [Vitreoscilla massiliensis]UOO91292.1 phosphatidylglycerophosphatase A [Vitreoscilla massiliensis]